MLHLIQSNKMEVLQQQLIALLKSNDSIDCDLNRILQPDTIIVQSPGMAQWLKLDIANALNIAANIDFPLPSSFIWKLYQQYFPDLPDTSSFTKDNMTWKLMQILPDFLHQQGFEQVNEYVKQSDQFKLFQLCQKVADVYDQYQVYRPDWIMDWEAGEGLGGQSFDTDIAKNHQWQTTLWRALVAQTQKLGESHYHRANLHIQLINKITEQQSSERLSPLYIFGISTLPQQQLEVFEALGQNRDIFLFWCNPCGHYWGDIVDEKTLTKRKLYEQLSERQSADSGGVMDVGNPLLASWGKPGRDYHEMLLMSTAQQYDYFIESQPLSMLEHIQQEVFELTMRGSRTPLDAEELLGQGFNFPKIPVSNNDNSIQLHSCHSMIRELEVLHDHILHQLENNPQLTPADIVVMMPDVAKYATFIDGVFGSVETELFVPYSISDRNVAQESDVIESFLQLLNLHKSRISLTDILTLLEVPAIAAKFEITSEEYENLRYWLNYSGFRWGWDGTDKDRWSLPDSFQNTFLFSLQRLVAGYATSSSSLIKQVLNNHFDTEQLFISPYPRIEGQEAVALGKLYEFAKGIYDVMVFCSQKDSIASKSHDALLLIERFYLVPEEQQIFLNKLRESIESVASHSAQYSGAIEQDIFLAAVKESVQNKGVGQRFLAGSVNFCTLMPMRSIPFSLVCLLGMNDQDYPRQTVPVGFDLVRHSPARRGDRSRRQDDRYLFLEALLSARKQLYLSFIGASARDNSARNPSILVSELIEYCENIFSLEDDGLVSLETSSTPSRNLHEHLLNNHCLQPFSRDYFDQQANLNSSFQQHWLTVFNRKLAPSQTNEFILEPLPKAEDAELATIELDEMLQFFNNTVRYFFNFRWRSGLQIFHDALIDEEPFSIDGLLRYQLNEALLASIDGLNVPDDPNHSTLLKHWQAQGILPVGEIGKIKAHEILADSDEFIHRLRTAIDAQSKHRTEVSLLLGEHNLQGWIQDNYGNNLVLSRPGKLRGQDKLRLWITWLCRCAMQTGLDKMTQAPQGKNVGAAFFVAKDKTFSLSAVTANEAKTELQKLAAIFQQGKCTPIPFFPNSAASWIETADLTKTVNTFDGNMMVNGEGQEANIQRLYPQLQPIFTEFEQLAQAITAPMYQWESKE